MSEGPVSSSPTLSARKGWVTFLAFVLPASVLLFLWNYGARILDPSNIDWLMDGADRATHYLGWLALREDAWRFPLGRTELILHPMGTSTGMTESATFVAVLLKAFVPSGIGDFQFSGAWLLFCFSALAGMSFRFLRVLGTPLPASALGSLLIASSAPLFLRIGHVVLCAHWLLVWAFVLFAEDRFRPHRWGFKPEWIALFVVVTGLNPYLTVMVLAVFACSRAVSAFETPSRRFGLVRSTLTLGAFTGSVFGLLGLWGYFQRYPVKTTAGGFGAVSSNLNTFYNSFGMTKFFPGLPTGPWQWEGYGYLGAGGLASVALCLGALAISKICRTEAARLLGRKGLLALLILAVGAFVYAVGSRPMLGSNELVDLSKVYAPFAKLTGTFRSSGRFIWIPFYLSLLVALGLLARTIDLRVGGNPRLRTLGALFIGALLAVQVYDLSGFRDRLQAPGNPFRPFLEEQWPAVRRDFDELLVFPPKIVAASVCVPPDTRVEDFQLFVHMALRNGLPTNSGYVGRPPETLIREECAKVRDELFRGEFRPRALYILEPAIEAELRYALGSTMMPCAKIDGYSVCAARSDAPEHFSKWLEAQVGVPEPLVATSRLDRNYDQTLLYTNLDGLMSFSYKARGRVFSKPVARYTFGPSIPAGAAVEVDLTRADLAADPAPAAPKLPPFPVTVRMGETKREAIFDGPKLTLSLVPGTELDRGTVLEVEIPEHAVASQGIVLNAVHVRLAR